MEHGTDKLVRDGWIEPPGDVVAYGLIGCGRTLCWVPEFMIESGDDARVEGSIRQNVREETDETVASCRKTV